MSKNYRAALSACLGDPVDGNPTGVMQEAAFAACGLNWRYLTIRVKDGDLAQAFAGQEQARERYDAAQIAYRRSIGGILAQTLEAGKPCPVCGSTDLKLIQGREFYIESLEVE